MHTILTFSRLRGAFSACAACPWYGLKAALLLILTLFLSAPAASAKPRITTSDWTIAETLTAMGHTPVSVADRRSYDVWVNYPPLPKSVKEAGLRFQPNLERLYQIKPDFFVQSNFYTAAKPQFEKVAPVYELSFGTDSGINYTHTVNTTRALGKLIGDSAAAEKLIRDTDALLAREKTALSRYTKRPLAVVQFSDGRNLRIYGKTSMFQVVLDKLGFKNAWTGNSNAWGFENITLVDLAKLPPDTLMIIVKPHPQNTRATLNNSTLWQRLPYSKPANRRVLDASWTYGALPSMQHFALQLAARLPSEKEAAW
ncbi:iron-siderophore ABC transporter substrate-binding protein [Neisseria perflava]|uniref:iron-siderophore ABC transporter substrate-binding protein n=1 Tax=Neisseria perflava TaxID=33053 RepID=UPI00209E2BD8|nr:iron-siderophore ABC transporter substrate-binding protein [Neisseria perflava]MCP1660405.1 iron complex transport system substrate-binding protein [Neisseria perflava]MCP1772087.1 iron complex transport system substrate-binding protein [Neisseria perflava]